ncbi:MAG TPA: BON domain-containing protein [Opitutaceae bacterium]|nr:BON domain-containing protein [Opitutaceae bacterium]
MKFLIILALGFALGIYVDRYQLRQPEDAKHAANESLASARDGFDEKMRQWRLTPDDIRQDLAHTGEVARTQAHAVREKISDARIVAVVKAKYILDRDLSACDIKVSAHDGLVALGGAVGSPELVGRAVALAMDTDGVSGVESKLEAAQP